MRDKRVTEVVSAGEGLMKQSKQSVHNSEHGTEVKVESAFRQCSAMSNSWF